MLQKKNTAAFHIQTSEPICVSQIKSALQVGLKIKKKNWLHIMVSFKIIVSNVKEWISVECESFNISKLTLHQTA